jgi:GT2 family glycosyltransferase
VSEPVPELSIIIASYNARSTIGACLQSLRGQRTKRKLEILLVDSSLDGTAEYVRERFPEVRVITSPRRLYCGDARNQAMGLARAGIVAFVDADCYVEDTWAEAVCEVHRQDNLLAGGIIDNAPTRNLVSWAYYFCEFSIWLPARHSRRIAEMAGCCLSMKRAAFECYGPFLEGTYCSDTAFQWKTRRDNIEILFSPAIRVYHKSPGELGRFFGHIYEHRRAFARVKCRAWHLSLPRRLAEMALLTVTPFLLLGITLYRLRFCWNYLPRFMAASPLIFLGYFTRSCGEFAGYLRPAREDR